MTVLAVTIAKPVSERYSKANLLQKAKGFALLLFLALNPKLNTSASLQQ
jgi:hypothetical protein